MFRLLGLLYLLISSFVHAETQDGWTLEREENGLKGYCKLHKSGYKYCKVVGNVDFTMKELVGINTDAAFLKSWMETVKHSEQVKRTSDLSYVNYIQFDIPYPYNDRDVASQTLISSDPGYQHVRLDFRSVDVVPKRVDHERMKLIKGYWDFRELGNGQRQMEYATFVNPGGNLYTWLFNPECLNVTWKTVENMLKVLETGKYRDADLPVLDSSLASNLP